MNKDIKVIARYWHYLEHKQLPRSEALELLRQCYRRRGDVLIGAAAYVTWFKLFK